MVVNIKVGSCSAAPAALPAEPASVVYSATYAAGQSNLAITVDEHGTVFNTIDPGNNNVANVESLGFFTVDGK